MQQFKPDLKAANKYSPHFYSNKETFRRCFQSCLIDINRTSQEIAVNEKRDLRQEMIKEFTNVKSVAIQVQLKQRVIYIIPYNINLRCCI